MIRSFGWIRMRSRGSRRARFRSTRIVNCPPSGVRRTTLTRLGDGDPIPSVEMLPLMFSGLRSPALIGPPTRAMASTTSRSVSRGSEYSPDGSRPPT